MASYWFQPSYNATTIGWMSSPNTRGTLDILWSCAQTAALCAWVSICVNIPSPGHGASDLIRDKFYFLLLTLLGPELVFLLAFTQYQCAAESVKLFKDLGHDDWTLTHGFYADMGGIHLQPPGWKRFPVSAKQLYHLVHRGYIDFPKIPVADIKARGKTDGLAK